MADPGTLLAQTSAAIAAIAGLGTAAAGLVDATKVFDGGISNLGFGQIKKALEPFRGALDHAQTDWMDGIRASWINGMPKDDQKAQAKSLIKLGLSSANAQAVATAGHVDPDRLIAILKQIEGGEQLTPEDANLFDRFNGAIDAAMEAGFERADQIYRNASKLTAGIAAILLAVWAGALIFTARLERYWFSLDMWKAVLVGLVAVPLAPVAKDLTSSLQAAAGVAKVVKT